MTDEDRRGRSRITALLATSVFSTGITFAATLNYAAIVGIEELGLSNAFYSGLLVASSLVSAAASVALGYLSDRLDDRRLLVIACALTGALGFGLIWAFRSPLVFVLSMGVIMPFGMALFSQTFAYARTFYDARDPGRAEFMNSVMRTIFAVAWAVVPPAVGAVAGATGVFNVYGIAALAFLASAAVFAVILRDPAGRVAKRPKPAASAGRTRAPAVDRTVVAGIGAIVLIQIAVQINMVSLPLLITTSLGGSYADLGLYAGLAAATELPFMLGWGYLLRWVPKHVVIVVAALLYGIYLYLLSRAGSVTDVLWLQLINGPATAALVSVPISYMQDAMRSQVGLSTSLLDVTRVVSVIVAAGLFALLTSRTPDYALMLVVAAVLSAAGALALLAVHRLLRPAPAVP